MNSTRPSTFSASEMDKLRFQFDAVGITCDLENRASLLKAYDDLISSKSQKQSIELIQHFESLLLKNGILSADKANARTNRTAVFKAKFDGDKLVDSYTGEDLSEIAKAYSLMKFGSVKEIEFFAEKVANELIKNVADSNHPLSKIISLAKNDKHHIVRIESGSRNVEHSGFLIFDSAMRKLNTYLALNGLPTTVRFRPTRLNVAPGNYAFLTKEQRESLAPTTDHIMPGEEIYSHNVHVIFSDDVRITGATADKAERSAVKNSALSYSDVYLIEITPEQALNMPEIEGKLNHVAVTGDLDETLLYILNQKNFRPVQRLLRLLLNEKNLNHIEDYLSANVPSENVVKIYLAALNNDYLEDPTCMQCLTAIRELLFKKNLVDANGMLIDGNYEY